MTAITAELFIIRFFISKIIAYNREMGNIRLILDTPKYTCKSNQRCSRFCAIIVWSRVFAHSKTKSILFDRSRILIGFHKLVLLAQVLNDKNYVSHIFKDLNEVLGRQRSLILLLYLLQVNKANPFADTGIRGKSNNIINVPIHCYLLQFLMYLFT